MAFVGVKANWNAQTTLLGFRYGQSLLSVLCMDYLYCVLVCVSELMHYQEIGKGVAF